MEEKPQLLTGILLPNVGVCFDRADSLINIEHLVLLVTAVNYLLVVKTLERNVSIKGSKSNLIEFGEEAPNYEGDTIATGKLLLWCVDRMELASMHYMRIIRAGSELIDDGSLDAAFELLKSK